MRRFWICLLLLGTLAGLGAWNAGHTETLCGDVAQLLRQGDGAAQAGRWGQAETLLLQAQERWERETPLLMLTLRHDLINDISSEMEETLVLLHWQEGAEFAASNTSVIAALEALAHSEQLTWANLL